MERPLPAKDIYSTAEPEVETVADTLEYNRNQNKMIARGNVVISYGDQVITSDYAEVETDTKKAFAKGHVIIFRKGSAIAQGEEAHYDFKAGSGYFPDGTVLFYPWRCRGETLSKVDEDTFAAEQAVFTTCKGENPPYEIHASNVTIHQDDKIVARNVTFYSLGVPFFWLPYLILPLQSRSMPFSVNGGYNSEYGAYIETTKGFSITENMFGEYHLDYRAKRGFGTGADVTYDYGKYAKGEVRGYWTQDERAPDPGAPNPYANLQDRDRGRLSWWHRTDFDEYTNLQLRYHRFADEFFLQDFFEKEHRGEIEPQSFATLTKNSEDYGSYIYVTRQMNDFERLVERMPEVTFDWKNQPFLGSSLVYYENDTSYANLSKEYGRMDFDQDVNRFDHVSEWFMPLRYQGWNVMPFASLRGTYYSRDKLSDDDHFRVVAGFGFDVRNHYFRTFDSSFDKFGIEVNRIRHVIEPYVSYEAFRSSLSDEMLTTFDEIDTLDDQDLVTVGVENRLQTKRVIDGRMQRIDIVSLNTFLGFSPNPHNESHGTSFTTFGQELILRPYNWLQYRVEYEYDFLGSRVNFFNQDIIARTNRFRFVIGHRYVSEDVDRNFGRAIVERTDSESTEFVLDARYRINDLWLVGGYMRVDTNRDGVEEWQVSATRDMDCLVFDFGYNVRNSDINESNKEIFFNLRLKHYPSIALRGGGSRSTFAEPKIGETVSGANEYYASSYQLETVY